MVPLHLVIERVLQTCIKLNITKHLIYTLIIMVAIAIEQVIHFVVKTEYSELGLM